VDGNDLQGMISLLRLAKGMKRPVLIHALTQKGKGYVAAENNPAKFHGVGKFDPATGENLKPKKPSFSDAFGQTMLELAAENDRVCAITAAMPDGTGLFPFAEAYPHRTFDVGIAEEHAVSMAGGLAKQGMIPVVAIYSTFLQRGFDQMMQDVALLGLHVVFAIDRAGLVGEDGPTHHGVFDIGYLRQIPGMKVLCPANFDQLQKMLRWAVEECTGPVAVRYPRGSAQLDGSNFAFCLEDVPCLQSGDNVTLISYGSLLKQVMQAAAELAQRNIHAQVLQISSATDFSVDLLVSQLRGKDVFVIEEAAAGSGIKQTVAWELQKRGYSGKVHGLDLGSDFTPHGDMEKLYRLAGIDADSIVTKVREVLCNEE
jgi:1-deoxy-D-xylulose-5-phosphate synthase